MEQMQDLMENSINKEFQERKRKRNKKTAVWEVIFSPPEHFFIGHANFAAYNTGLNPY